MNNYGIDNKKKIFILIIISAFVVVPVALYLLQPNSYGAGIDIKGYSKYINDLPRDSKDSLNTTLYNIVKMNLPDNTDINVKDAYIRDKASTTKEYNKTTKLTSGSFIVDIASLKQSYMMYYEWSNETNAEYSGYPVTAKCLPVDKLKYGDFNCKDMFSILKEARDPIMDYLPHETANYKVTASYDNNERIMLDVDIRLSELDVSNNGRENSIARYKADFAYWMTWIGYNIENYTVNYTAN